MSGKNKFSTKDFLEVIPGSDGIISVIARRLNADWNTCKKYIEKYPSIKQAYDDECQSLLDAAESNVAGSIHGGNVADSKWYLYAKGHARGYGAKPDTMQDDDTPFQQIKYINVINPHDVERDATLARLANESGGYVTKTAGDVLRAHDDDITQKSDT